MAPTSDPPENQSEGRDSPSQADQRQRILPRAPMGPPELTTAYTPWHPHQRYVQPPSPSDSYTGLGHRPLMPPGDTFVMPRPIRQMGPDRREIDRRGQAAMERRYYSDRMGRNSEGLSWAETGSDEFNANRIGLLHRNDVPLPPGTPGTRPRAEMQPPRAPQAQTRARSQARGSSTPQTAQPLSQPPSAMPSLRSQPEFYMTAVTPIDTTAEPLPGNTECTICLERLTTDVVRFRACGHMFHTVCVLSWFDESAPRSGRRRGTCPNCRQELYEPDPRSAGASTSNLQRIQEMQAEINRLIADRRGHESNYLQGPRPAQYPIWGPLQSSAQATRAGSTSAQSSDGGPLPNTDSSRYPHFIESGNRLAQNMFGDSPLSVPGRGRGMHPQIQSWPPRPAHGQEIDTEPEARSRRDNQATDASEPDLSEVPAPEQESRATLAARAIAERRPLTELETEWPAAASLPDEEEEEVFSLFEERSRALREGRPWQRGGMREQIGAQERLSNDRTPITTLPNERLLSEIGRLNARADQLRLQLLQNMEHDENRFSSPSLNPPPIPELQGSAVPFAQPARTDAELRAFFSSLPHPREQGLDRGRVPSQQHTPRRYATTANTTASPARNSHQDRTTTLRNHTPEWRTFHRDENTETGHTHTPTNGNPTRERQPHTRTDHYGFTTTQHRPHRPDPREPLGQLYMPHLAANMDELRELDDTPRPAYSPASATFSGGREMQLSESDEGDGLDEGFSDSG